MSSAGIRDAATPTDASESAGQAEQDRGSEFEPRALLRKSIPAFVAIAVLILIAIFAPGLGEVREKLVDASPGWVLLAIVFEALSFGSYIVMFAPVFCRGMSWKRSWEIGGSELAVDEVRTVRRHRATD